MPGERSGQGWVGYDKAMFLQYDAGLTSEYSPLRTHICGVPTCIYVHDHVFSIQALHVTITKLYYVTITK